MTSTTPTGARAPATSADFDSAYRAPFTLWGDVRIPPEIKELSRRAGVKSALELGCGVGRFSRYVAQQGLRVQGVDFSPVAIDKARERVAQDEAKPSFMVGDVTNLEALTGPFDVSFDVGCFHCLDRGAEQRYVAELSRLLAPGGTHLLWALDASPSDLPFSPDFVKGVFAPRFQLVEARPSRRRLVRSHWYWLVRDRA